MTKLNCLSCQKEMRIPPSRKSTARFCSRKCIHEWSLNSYFRLKESGELEGTLEAHKRFNKKFIKTNSCWIWHGAKQAGGYGTCKIIKHGRKLFDGAHRISFRIHKGHIKKGLIVCHSCDTPACINPDHLFVGTYKDNTRDMIKKGRFIPIWYRMRVNEKSGMIVDKVLSQAKDFQNVLAHKLGTLTQDQLTELKKYLELCWHIVCPRGQDRRNTPTETFDNDN